MRIAAHVLFPLVVLAFPAYAARAEGQAKPRAALRKYNRLSATP